MSKKKPRFLVSCACGCGTEFINIISCGVEKKFVRGHNKPWLGKKREISAEHRISLSEAGKKVKHTWGLKGNKNPAWKGGVTAENILIRSSVKYLSWVKDILGRDNYTCNLCGTRGGSLQVHHKVPFSIIIHKMKSELGENNIVEKAMGYSFLWDSDNAETLCVGCHKKTDTYLKGRPKKEVLECQAS